MRNKEDMVGINQYVLGHLGLISLIDIPVEISTRKLNIGLVFRGEVKAADAD